MDWAFAGHDEKKTQLTSMHSLHAVPKRMRMCRADEGGLSKLDECRFAVVAPVTLKPVLIHAGSGRFDAGNHHLASTLWTFRPVDGWKPKKNKQGLEHGLLV